MTTVGHTLVGLALRNASAPRSRSPAVLLFEVGLFTALANLPDLDLPGWGHRAYHFSHSVFVLAVLLLVLTPAALPVLRRLYPPRSAAALWAGACAALFSHVFLDGLYGVGRGIALLWPLSDARLHLPVPFFHHLRPQDGLTPENLRVCAVEAAVFGCVLLVSLALRRIFPGRDARSSLGGVECRP